MAIKDHTKVALCLPWYNGADRDCTTHFLQFQHYLGRLSERLQWIAAVSDSDEGHVYGISEPSKLDPHNSTGFSEVPSELLGKTIEFGLVDEVGCSLPGMARERCVDNALNWGADVLLFYDDDMLFGTDLFLRLFLADKPVVAALAFTARDPIAPVIYTFRDTFEADEQRIRVDIEPLWEYKRDSLQQVDAVGSGVFMIQSEVFRQIPKPWFNSPGLGEDIFFCLQCRKYNIPVWVNTAAKTVHKPTFVPGHLWADEGRYLRSREVKE